MTDPAGNAKDAVKNATEAIAALKRIRPQSDLEARALCAQILQANELLVDASKTAIQATVVQRATNGRARGRVEATSLSDGVLKSLAESIVPYVKAAIGAELAPVIARIAALEQRPQLAYEGVWDAAKVYTAGSFVTHGGSLWHAEDSSVGVRPGTGSNAWRLAVKRGRADR